MTDRALTIGEETFPAKYVVNSTVTSSNDLIRLSCWTATKSETVTQVVMVSGSTAAVGATMGRMGLYLITGSAGSYTGKLIASTANDVTLFSAASTVYTRAFTAPAWKTAGLRYGIGAIVRGTSTAPTLQGLLTPTAMGAAVLMDPPDTLTMSGQTDLPNPGTFTQAFSQPWAAVLP